MNESGYDGHLVSTNPMVPGLLYLTLPWNFHVIILVLFFRVREVCLKELKFYVDVLSVANFGVRLILSVVIIMIHLLNKLYRIHHHYQIFIILSSFIFYTHKRYMNFVYLFFDCPIQLQKLGL